MTAASSACVAVGGAVGGPVGEVKRVAAGGTEVTMAALAGVATVAVAMLVVTGVERAMEACSAGEQVEASPGSLAWMVVSVGSGRRAAGDRRAKMKPASAEGPASVGARQLPD